MMKTFVLLLAGFPLPLVAQEKPASPAPAIPADFHPSPRKESGDPEMRRTLGLLETKLGVKFNRPFPVAILDIDASRRQPIALLATDLGKVAATRPTATPFDGGVTIEWLTGGERIDRLATVCLDAYVDLNEAGEFCQIALIASPGEWTAEDGTAAFSRGESETEKEFTDRVLLTYRIRARKADDEQQALLLLSGFGKMLRTIDRCRQAAE